MTVKAQYHEKFKVFLGAQGTSPVASMEKIARSVATWSRKNPVAPKSVGVEWVEGRGLLVVTVGYCPDPAKPYPVAVRVVSIGKQFHSGKKTSAAAIAKQMGKAAAAMGRVICHEFFVTDDGEMILVFMSHAK